MAADYNDVESGSRATHTPLVLDGATGTELERRGVRSTLPLWSSWALLEAPDVVRQIHADYLAAGVDALTAATFRTHARSLAAAGLEARAAELTHGAVRLAREAIERAGRPALVLGSAAPLEDCYHPERVPDEPALSREHAAHARHLVAAGVDVILAETINTRREGVAVARAAHEAGARLWISFVCAGPARLLSGEPLREALDAVHEFAPERVGVNCLAAEAVEPCLPVLRGSGRPFLVYPNADSEGRRLGADEFASHALRWTEVGASAVGGCCGIGPAHLRAWVTLLRHGANRASQ